MDASFQGSIANLRLARELVGDETQQLARAEAGDHQAALCRLAKAAITHQEQANVLLVKMFDQSAPEDLR